MFYGRKEELKEINEALSNNHFEAILLYGRRRVGKTELINEVSEHYRKKVIHFECRRTIAKENLRLLSQVINEAFELPETNLFSTFDELIHYVFRKSVEEEFLFVIDEFSFLLMELDDIDSTIAVYIDQYKRKSKMKLLISGSYVYLMSKMIEYNAHLYGRFTRIIHLKPMNYYDSALFYSSYSNEDKILIYSVFGGVPFFNSLIDTKKSAIQNVIDLVVKKDAILEAEIQGVLLNETNKINDSNAIITLIGDGYTKYKDLLSVFTDGSSRFDYAMKRLLDMDIIEKIVPINTPNNKKNTYYRIKDPLMNFYYQFIFPNLQQRNVLSANLFFEEYIKDRFYEHYLPTQFENITKEFLIRQNNLGKISPTILDIGTYFYHDSINKVNRQFDVVTKDKNGYISYECKYKNNKINQKVIETELEQTNLNEIGFYKLGFVSKEGFASNIDSNKYVLYKLEDFYK